MSKFQFRKQFFKGNEWVQQHPVYIYYLHCCELIPSPLVRLSFHYSHDYLYQAWTPNIALTRLQLGSSHCTIGKWRKYIPLLEQPRCNPSLQICLKGQDARKKLLMHENDHLQDLAVLSVPRALQIIQFVEALDGLSACAQPRVRRRIFLFSPKWWWPKS